ncbi:hypothetical protein AMECASPLE_030197 [Ameca splendens]|uniref:Uncharacterized protein n=1 Tax=Ameca splendens TaxID=208324 RepID=A0ABV0Z3V4_9TELE
MCLNPSHGFSFQTTERRSTRVGRGQAGGSIAKNAVKVFVSNKGNWHTRVKLDRGGVKRLEGEAEEDGVWSVSLHGCVLDGRALQLADQRVGGFRDAVVLVTGSTGGSCGGDLGLNKEEEYFCY